LRAIIIKTPGTKIRVRKGVVVVENDNGRIEVTPANCDVLIAVTARFTVTGMALRYLMRQGIDFVVMDKRGEPLGRFFPLVINKTIAARRAQYLAMFDGRGYRGVLKVIECKLRNQAAVLKYFAKSRRSEILREEAYIIERITDEFASKIPDLTPQEVLEYEAWVARRYWSTLASLLPEELGFIGRKQEGTDPFNMALNYGYGILYYAVERALLLVGLDPYGGYLHKDKSGKQTLVFDFIEQFRPVAVDKPLVANACRIPLSVVHGVLSYETRSKIAEVVVRTLNTHHMYHGKSIPLEHIILREAHAFARYLRGSLEEYEGYRAWW